MDCALDAIQLRKVHVTCMSCGFISLPIPMGSGILTPEQSLGHNPPVGGHDIYTRVQVYTYSPGGGLND